MAGHAHAPSDEFGEFVGADARAQAREQIRENAESHPGRQRSNEAERRLSMRSDLQFGSSVPTAMFEPSSLLDGDAPVSEEPKVLDLRDVERRLDEQRRSREARDREATDTAAAVASAAAAPDAAEPITIASATSPSHPRPPESPLRTGSWSDTLWRTWSSFRQPGVERGLDASPAPTAGSSGTDSSPAFAEHAHRRRRPSVVGDPRAHVPIAGAPAFDPRQHMHRWNTGDWSLDAQEEARRQGNPIPVVLTGRRDDTDVVCEPWHAARIQAALPRRLRLGRTWRLIYSVDQHGSSLSTLYDRVARAKHPSQRGTVTAALSAGDSWMRGSSTAAQQAALGGGSAPVHVGGGVSLADAGLVVAIRDDEDNVFGAYVNEQLRPTSHYYGNGECFLWKTVRRRLPQPPSESAGIASNDDDLHPELALEVFRWTGKNDYMVLTEAHYLSVGGGDGRYGLWVDSALENGTSAPCPAYNNPILCNAQPSEPLDLLSGDEDQGSAPSTPRAGRFQCIGLEVWAVGLD